MPSDRSNRPRLEDISAMPAGEITKLPAKHLALLQDDASAALETAKCVKDRLDGAIALRYAEQAAVLRQQQGKDTGTVRFEDGDVTVVTDLPKKVEWDQQQIAALVKRIRDTGEDPADYVEITFKVPSTPPGPSRSARPSRPHARCEPASPLSASTSRRTDNGHFARLPQINCRVFATPDSDLRRSWRGQNDVRDERAGRRRRADRRWSRQHQGAALPAGEGLRCGDGGARRALYRGA
jgi:hypothetical protein